MQKKEMHKKIVVLGNPAVGKTSIILRYIHGKFESNYKMTLGFNIYSRKVSIAETKLGLAIWDIGGQESFKRFAFRYLQKADAAIFVTDVTRPHTVDFVDEWNEKLSEVVSKNIPKIILFNKIDLDYTMSDISDRISASDSRSTFNGVVFASAKTGENINDIFSMIAKMLVQWDEGEGVVKHLPVKLEDSFDAECVPVIFFTSESCKWCKPVFKRLTNISEEFPMDIKVVDVETDVELAKTYVVHSLPTTIIGSKTVVGDTEEDILRTFIGDEYMQLFGL